MTAVDTSAASEKPRPLRTRKRGIVVRFRENRAGMIALGYICCLIVVAILAPLLSPYDPSVPDMRALRVGPLTAGHLLGTDELGRDVLSRLLYASRVAVAAPFIAIAVALVLGVLPGLISGYMGGWVDLVIMRINDALQSFPPILLAMGLITVLGPGLVNAMLAVGIVFAPGIVRIVRSSVQAIRREHYVEAAITIGTPLHAILARHILPNAIGPLLVQASLLTGFALLAEATLSFIGLGMRPPDPSWGSMLSSGFRMLGRQPWLWIWPALMLGVTVLAWNIIGDALRDSIGREERRG